MFYEVGLDVFDSRLFAPAPLSADAAVLAAASANVISRENGG